MAFEWLITPENRIEVIEHVKNRDEDHIADLVIGYGYGVFRGQTAVEYSSQNAGSFNHVGILIDYHTLPNASVTVDGKVYKATHKYPEIGDVCTWRGITFAITGVDPRPNVHGDLVGFTVRCSSG